MAPTLRSKLPNVGTTIFTVMSQLAHDHHALNLAQGFPNFAPSEQLLEYAAEAMHNGMNQYAPMTGLKPLRERIADKHNRLYGASYNADTDVTVTPGGTAALFAAIAAVVQQGDEVLIFEPCYDSYIPTIELCGGRAVSSALQFPAYSVDWDDVRSKLSPRTRLIILNTPHNPSGRVWKQEDMLTLQELTRDTGILILSDEVYEHIIFDGAPHQSVARYPELAARSFVVASFGKTFHVTGWKVGYCLAPAPLMAEFRKVHQFMTFCTNTPAQYAFSRMLENTALYENLGAFYQRKRDTFRSLLQGSRFDLLPCEGSYFQLVRYDQITQEQDTTLAVRLTKETGVASIPVSVFYTQHTDNHVLRLCFAKTDDTLEQAAERLCTL